MNHKIRFTTTIEGDPVLHAQLITEEEIVNNDDTIMMIRYNNAHISHDEKYAVLKKLIEKHNLYHDIKSLIYNQEEEFKNSITEKATKLEFEVFKETPFDNFDYVRFTHLINAYYKFTKPY